MPDVRCQAVLRQESELALLSAGTTIPCSDLIDSLKKNAYVMDFGIYGQYTPVVSESLEEDLPQAIRENLSRSRGLGSKSVLTVSVTVRGPEIDLQPGDQDVSDEEVQELWRSTVAEKLEDWIRDLVMAINIARPGSISVAGGFVLCDSCVQLEIAPQFTSVLGFASVKAQRVGWPKISDVPVWDVWNWLALQPGFRDRYGGLAIGRALNALSHIIRDESDDPVVLMWAMVGLESVFTTHKESVLQQMRDGIRALLGYSEQSKKLIQSMYDLRSKFIHGGLDFEGAQPPEPDLSVERARQGVSDAMDMAISILLATLQELVQRGWLGVQFTTVCEAT